MTIPNDKVIYATLPLRIKAAILDSVIILALLIILPLTLGQFLSGSDARRAVLMYSPLLFLEPFLISFFGNTLGQYIFGIKVVRENDFSKCPLPSSFLRYYVKTFLGWLSLIYMLFSKKYQAIHDHAAKTLVILSPARIEKDPAFVEKGVEEEIIDDEFIYPSTMRRFFIFIMWFVIAEVGLITLPETLVSLISPESMNGKGNLPKSIDQLISLISSFVLIGLALLAAKGRLLGARRTRKAEDLKPTIPNE